jgi:hypothetical protein
MEAGKKASFDKVNYSLRPSKTIERALAFDGLKKLQFAMDTSNQVYVGFGSIWFSDFHIAHRTLGISDMVSMESDSIGFARAKFNLPYRTVRIVNQLSSDALPELYNDPLIKDRPWIIWLDYDSPLETVIVEDVRSVVENAPANSILLITFDASEDRREYGAPKDRKVILEKLFSTSLPDIKREDVDELFPETVARLSTELMIAAAVDCGRPGGFIPAFSMIYQDTATMVTIGGVLPKPGAAATARAVINDAGWPGNPAMRIVAPHLTVRESAVLQSQLPRTRRLTRAAIRRLGFDLQEDQLAAFERYYLYYPSFAQVSY